MDNRVALEFKIRNLVGIPFVNRGRDAKGYDCWGLFMEVQKRIGNPVRDFQLSCFDTQGIFNAAISEIQSHWEPVTLPEPGDAVAMALDPNLPDIIQHFGVYIGSGKFIHTLERIGCLVSNLSHPMWKNRVRGFYRWKS